jgi:hypothetical protein
LAAVHLRCQLCSAAAAQVTGSAYWPLVNIFNFRYVPSTHRVLYVNGCGLLWNAYLRWGSAELLSSELRAGLG